MSDKDVTLLEMTIKSPERYQITVDNDGISVWDNKKDDFAGDFDNYGYDFIYDLLSYLKCNVEYA